MVGIDEVWGLILKQERDKQVAHARQVRKEEQLAAFYGVDPARVAAWPKLRDVNPADVTARALYHINAAGQAVPTDVKRDEPSEHRQERTATGYRGQSFVRCVVTKQQDVDGWECIGGMDCDGAPDDLLPTTRAPKQPIPLKVPAKRGGSINAGFWMQRAINAAAEPRSIKHVLTLPDDKA